MSAMPWLETSYLRNSLQAWIIALAIAAAALVLMLIVRGAITRRMASRAAQTTADLDDLVVDLLRRTRWYFLLSLSLAAGALALELPRTPTRVLETGVVLVILLQAGVWGSAVIAYLLKQYVRLKIAEDPAAATTVGAFGFLARLALWTFIAFIALASFGVNITALVAGLGVGGIAVALALQNILGDLFASFSIVLDKPFVIGDFIIVDDYPGTVEHVGLKTTRIRSLWGEQVIFANSDLLKSRVRNFKRMVERRIVFGLGVTYQTPREKLIRIPAMIREAVEAQEQTRFDRAHFKAYGDYALQFEVVYYILSPAYNTYMDAQQAINLEIHRRFEEAGIEFAYPTQVLYVARGGAVGST